MWHSLLFIDSSLLAPAGTCCDVPCDGSLVQHCVISSEMRKTKCEEDLSPLYGQMRVLYSRADRGRTELQEMTALGTIGVQCCF